MSRKAFVLRPVAAIALGLTISLGAAMYPAAAQNEGAESVIPSEYVVQQGDTLWDIASRYFKNPWDWHKIWERNPQLDNPHLIYPGDLIVLMGGTGMDGDASRGDLTLKVVRLTPRAKELPLPSIPVVRPELVLPYLNDPGFITDQKEYENMAYVLSGIEDPRIYYGENDRIYAIGLDETAHETFDIVRMGPEVQEGGKGQTLGYRLTHVGIAKMMKQGDVSSLLITNSYQEILPGDRIKPRTHAGDLTFMPELPEKDIKATIVLRTDDESGKVFPDVGQGSSIIFDKGTDDGVKQGHVLDIYSAPKRITNEIKGGHAELPSERVGRLLVFRTFHNHSYGLIMESDVPVQMGDEVRTPQP